MLRQSKEEQLCVDQCGRKRAKDRKRCYTCQRRHIKEINPVGYTFDLLKQNAKRRRIKFLLTLNDFIDFIQANPLYMFKKGRGKDDLTIDRKIAKLGYVPGNLQVLPNGDNVRKARREYTGYKELSNKQTAGTPF